MKCNANLAQQTRNVTHIQYNKLSNVYFLFFGLNREPQTPNLKLFTVISLSTDYAK